MVSGGVLFHFSGSTYGRRDLSSHISYGCRGIVGADGGSLVKYDVIVVGAGSAGCQVGGDRRVALYAAGAGVHPVHDVFKPP